MPVVVIPKVFLDLAEITPDSAECRVEGRTVPEVEQELIQYYPQLFTRFKDATGQPSVNWFGLYRDQDEDDLRRTSGVVLGDNDRIYLINYIGC